MSSFSYANNKISEVDEVLLGNCLPQEDQRTHKCVVSSSVSQGEECGHRESLGYCVTQDKSHSKENTACILSHEESRTGKAMGTEGTVCVKKTTKKGEEERESNGVEH